MHTSVKSFVKRYVDFVFGLGFLIVEAVLYTQTYKIRALSKLSDNIGPRFVPRLILAVLMLLSLILTVKGFLKGRSGGGGEASSDASPGESFKGGSWIDRVLHSVESDKRTRSLIAIGGILVFLALLEPLGFLISAAVYLFAQMLILSPREKRSVLRFSLIAVFGAFATYACFKYLINVNLPQGFIKFL